MMMLMMMAVVMMLKKGREEKSLFCSHIQSHNECSARKHALVILLRKVVKGLSDIYKTYRCDDRNWIAIEVVTK